MRRIRGILLIGTAALLAGCSTPTSEPAASGTSEMIADTHRLQNEELRYLMRSLNEMVANEPQSALERDDMRRRYAGDLAGRLKTIADKIDALPESRSIQMDAGERREFDVYVQQLRAHSETIGEIADRYALERLDGAMEAMVRTCNACHERFDFPAPVIGRRH
jgi:TolA-binding protein